MILESSDTRGGARTTDVEAILPLSPLQEGMLFHSIDSHDSDPFLIQLCYSLSGDLNVPALRAAWEAVVRSHSSLRTLFLWERRDRPLQVVRRGASLAWQEHDWRSLPSSGHAARLQSFLKADRERGFQLAKSPPIRINLIATGDRAYRLILTYHHIILDGWSLALVWRQILAAYEVGGRIPGDSPANLQFRDYLAWLRQQDPAPAEVFWRRTLEGFRRPTLFRPRSVEPPASGIPEFMDFEVRLPQEETAALSTFARAHHLTLNTLVQAAWALVLRAQHQTDDVLFGATVSGRSSGPAGCESIVGLLINTLPVRLRFAAGEETVSWLRRFQAHFLQILQYEHVSLTTVHSWSELQGNAPWFDSLIVFENYPVYEIEPRLGAAVKIDNVEAVEATNYPLTIAVAPGKCLLAKATYDVRLFSRREIERLMERYRMALAGLADGSGRLPGEIPLLTEGERHTLLMEWNATGQDGPPNGCVHELFEAQARRTPDVVAVVAGEEQVTYRDLDQRANRLAHRLRHMGVGPEVRVGLSLERSSEMVVAILAVLKAGGAYVPLDPSYPGQRLAWILSDARLRAVITGRRTSLRFHDPACELWSLESLAAGLEGQPASRPVSGVTPVNLAYVMYTSGSTGAPKGVMVPHRSLCHYAWESAQRYAMEPGDRVLQFASIGFDTSVEEIFSCLTGGATLVVPADMDLEPRVFWRACTDLRLTVLDLPTAYWRELANDIEQPECDLSGVRLVIIGGEQAQRTPWLTWRRRMSTAARLLNTYGPTETTVVATMFDQDRPESDNAMTGGPPIGRPIANTRVYLLDGRGELAPEGAMGEIYIGGAGVARGYLGRARMTAERFVPDRFGAEAGARLYRTGDLGRHLADGMLEFLGRRDHQVKVRGYRIELGEIEAALAQHPDVREAVVIAREETTGDKRLEAFVVARGLGLAGAGELREYLRQRLPAYMAPAAIEMLDELPLSANGKIDRERLPVAGRRRGDTGEEKGYVAPRTPVEEVLAAIWAEVLKMDRIGVHDNFFELGGHSLLAIQVLSRIRGAFQFDLPIRALFETPVLWKLAQRIEQAFARSEAGEEVPLRPAPPSGHAPLAKDQQQIWAHNQSLPKAAFFNLGGALRLAGPLDRQALEDALSQIVMRHEALRTVFPLVDGRVVQRVGAPRTPALQLLDLSGLQPAERDAAAVRVIAEESYGPFDLTREPPMRASLIELAPEDHVLLLTVHHIMADGWAVRVLLGELAALYAAVVSKRPSPLPELSIQYRDFAAWQELWLKSADAHREIAYWTERLTGLPILVFPGERPAPAARTFFFSRREIVVAGSEWDTVRKMSRAESVTEFMTLLAALCCVVYRRTGVADPGIATQIANRNRVELEPMIGFFANTLVLRTDLSGDPTVRQVLWRARTTTLAACAHANLPFDYLQEALAQDPASQALLPGRILLTHENAPPYEPRLAGLTVTPLRLPPGSPELVFSGYDIIIQAESCPDTLHATMQFNADLFDGEMIDRIAAEYVHVLKSLPARIDARLSTIASSGGLSE